MLPIPSWSATARGSASMKNSRHVRSVTWPVPPCKAARAQRLRPYHDSARVGCGPRKGGLLAQRLSRAAGTEGTFRELLRSAGSSGHRADVLPPPGFAANQTAGEMIPERLTTVTDAAYSEELRLIISRETLQQNMIPRMTKMNQYRDQRVRSPEGAIVTNSPRVQS